MPYMREHNGIHYAIQHMYSVPDDAWYLELCLASAPTGDLDGEWFGGIVEMDTFLIAIVPDEDPSREPVLSIHRQHELPYSVLCWFMGYVVDEIDRAKLAMAQAESPGEDDAEPT